MSLILKIIIFKLRRDYPFIEALLLLFCSINLMLCQNEQDSISFHHIKNGLSQNSATVIMEDNFGFLWVGTQNGLNKFDGTTFEIFEQRKNKTSGLSNGYVEDLYEGVDDTLYIATTSGLDTYNRDLGIIERYPFKEEGLKLSTKHFTHLTKSGKMLFLGTSNEGLFSYDHKTGKTNHLQFENDKNSLVNQNFVLKVFDFADDKLLLITYTGIYIINYHLEVISEIPINAAIRSARQLNPKKYLVGLGDGSILTLNMKEKNTFEKETFSICPGYSILSIEADSDGNYWIGSENSGLYIFNTSTKELKNLTTDKKNPSSISNNSIWSLYRDSNDIMWVGPFKYGLSFYDKKYGKFEHIQNNPFVVTSLGHNDVNCFIEDESQNIWIGTDGGGLYYWDRIQNTFEEFSLNKGNLNSDVILSLVIGKQGNLWIGSWDNGLTIFDTKTKNYKSLTKKNSFLASDHIMDLIEDRQGRIWIASVYGNLQVYDPITKTHKDIELKSSKNGSIDMFVIQIFEDNTGHIWVGSRNGGIYRLTENSDSFSYTHFAGRTGTNAISNDFINTIVQDSDDVIWVGTQVGLNKYNTQKNTFDINIKGFEDVAVKGIQEDKKGNLWISSDDGIVQYNSKTGETLNYDMDDGLQNSAFNRSSFYETKNGEFLFGGGNGFNLFKPESIQKRIDVPKVFLTGLKIFNTPVTPKDKFKVLQKDISQVDSVTLNYDHDVIDFEFNALTFRHPEKVNYAYFLDGFETDWNYVGHKKSATYTNLSPGEYTLRIKSSNSDGVWNDNETKLHITVTPPFWETWWFRSLLAASLILGFYLMHYIKINNVKKHQITLERKIDERTSQLRQQKKKLEIAADELASKNEEIQRFAFAVSHDLKSPLSGIKGIASLIPMEFVMKDFPELEKYLEMINISCDTMNDLIADITKIARLGKIENKTEVLNTNEIVDLSITLVKGKLDAKNVKLKIDDNLPSIYGDRNRIIQVFGNLLDNAIKYMGDQQNPLVCIEAQENGDKIQFSVKDNGSGMSEQDLKKLFSPFERFHANVTGTGLGLYMIKQIVESHGGNIHAESDGKGKGATFVVALPNPINEQNQDKIQDELISEVTY